MLQVGRLKKSSLSLSHSFSLSLFLSLSLTLSLSLSLSLFFFNSRLKWPEFMTNKAMVFTCCPRSSHFLKKLMAVLVTCYVLSLCLSKVLKITKKSSRAVNFFLQVLQIWHFTTLRSILTLHTDIAFVTCKVVLICLWNIQVHSSKILLCWRNFTIQVVLFIWLR